MRGDAVAVDAGQLAIVTDQLSDLGHPNHLTAVDDVGSRESQEPLARARIARLTLQLRSARCDADDAERQASAVDAEVEAARTAVLQRIERLAEDDRSRRAAELEAARAEAATLLEAARARAVATAIDGRPRAAVATSEAEPQPTPEAEPQPTPEPEPAREPDPEPDPQPMAAPLAAVATPPGLLVDSVALAEAVAAGVSAALLHTHAVRRAEPSGKVGRRRSFAARLLHLDVLLPLVAAIIVVSVLLAWTV